MIDTRLVIGSLIEELEALSADFRNHGAFHEDCTLAVASA